MYPIVASLSRVQGSTPDSDASRRRLGSYLALTSVQVNTVTSAMFVTAMAGNPVAQKAAADLGIEITWGGWALAALVPGLDDAFRALFGSAITAGAATITALRLQR